MENSRTPIDALPDVRNAVVTDVSDKVPRIDLIVPCATGVLVPLTGETDTLRVNKGIEGSMMVTVAVAIVLTDVVSVWDDIMIDALALTMLESLNES